jgi:hypothetical protein
LYFTLSNLHALSYTCTCVDENFNVHVTIEIAALSVLIASDGMRRAISDRHQDSSHGYVFDLEKISRYSRRPLLAELLILCGAEFVVRGVAGNFDHVAYTFSKSIDDAGDSLGTAIAGQGVYNDQTKSLLSAVCLTLIELTDWLSAVRGAYPAPATRQAQPFANSEMAGVLQVS